jgi:ATP-dependent DNA helicase RecQ
LKSIAIVDTEVDPQNKLVLDIGSVKMDGSQFHRNSVPALSAFLRNTEFVGGHNIFQHDLKYIEKAIRNAGIDPANIIDTLYLSPLLFPSKPYHALLKDDKLQTEETNNPLNDAIKAKHLLFDELAAFEAMNEGLRQILYLLLKDQKEFRAFFSLASYSCAATYVERLIGKTFSGSICENAGLKEMVAESPVELAYCLSIIRADDRYSITPAWVLKNYPEVERILSRLRNTPCARGCAYCAKALDIRQALKKYFGFEAYRTYGGEPLQEKAVKAAVDGKSILAVFPTGGGKSITFQIPALMSGENIKGLTVVISPLQSLMKDQVDNLEKSGITNAVTINGLLDVVERGMAFERVADGSASMLYISPESLRSRTIENLLLGRKIARFVIDEAHCFSSWGQDFRVDYMYIGDFIRKLKKAKGLTEAIPVSCFTATAKLRVIEDIQAYFREKLGLELELFTSKASRTNLQYKVVEKSDEIEKYQELRDLIEKKNCPTIVYASRTRTVYDLAKRLTADGFIARPYHGKMEVKEKTTNQNAFIAGEVSIMVATSAFGMGVDKKDVGLVIHYEISDSLENYVQEAGRAGRDEKIKADCFVLFNEEDLAKHLQLLNQTKLSIKEIQQVWKAIKELTRFRSTVSNSALEIARKAGWDDTILEIETRVTTAVAALEDSGYLRRGQNMPRVFANSIMTKTAQEAIDMINGSSRFEADQKEAAIRIVRKLFSSKRKSEVSDEAAESRIDYIGDHLGISREDVINIINLLREEKILADSKDLSAFIKKGGDRYRSLEIVETFCSVEQFLLPYLGQEEQLFNLKELSEQAELDGLPEVTAARIKTIINFWAIKKWLKREGPAHTKNHVSVIAQLPTEVLRDKLEKRQELARFIIDYLDKRGELTDAKGDDVPVEFSVHELKDAYLSSLSLYKVDAGISDVEDALFFLSRIEAIKIEGGFLVIYNRLHIERLEQNNKKQYTRENYRPLNDFYESKVQQIHIVGEYARKMIKNYKEALQFVDDYFQLTYPAFLKKYFPGKKADTLSLKTTPARFEELFGELSPLQLKIVKDTESKHIVIAAGPGSGKTKLLVHKLASLLLMEDVRHEQLLMVTFSRASATEFRQRLLKLIGKAALFVEIKTFHSYCFDLLGRVGSVEKSKNIIKMATQKINDNEVEHSKITKTVLVIDEAQDMTEGEYDLVTALMDQNEEMQVIAVGDDDQNVYSFRDSSSEYMKAFITTHGAVKYELVDNYRSKSNLVDFANQLAQGISVRLKKSPNVATQRDNGKIELVRYEGEELIVPLVENLLATDLAGTTCVLTYSNEDALQITGLLRKQGAAAKLIQTNDSFNLYNLAEIRFFLERLKKMGSWSVINEGLWQKAKQELREQFYGSTMMEPCENMLREFESANPEQKYISDLEIFIRESKLEDFYSPGEEGIVVSTIHKAKGKEFDNVFLLWSEVTDGSDEQKRLVYVAVTRAKKSLSIHTNSDLFDGIVTDDMVSREDPGSYPPPDELAMQLGYRDVVLNHFKDRQELISQLVSGQALALQGRQFLMVGEQDVLKFSRQCLGMLEDRRKNGYELKSGRVNFVVFWQGVDADEEIKIILPEIYLERVDANE